MGYYTNHLQLKNRYNTDSQFIELEKGRSFFGIMDKQARFIEQNQLFDELYWQLFVKQFSNPADHNDEGWRGEYFGKMMRGSCMTYQYTKNEELYSLLERAVVNMLTTQDGSGRFSTYLQNDEFKGWDMWCRKYVLLGLLHFHEICKDEALKERIIEALTLHLDYICSKIGSGDKMDIGATSGWWFGINSASILEPVIKMYNITGKKEYLEFAEHILDFLINGSANIITLALEKEKMPYQYPVTKAYEMMSCFEGVLEYYRITGKSEYLTAAIEFVDAVYATDITLIGCAGCEHELFNYSVATQTDTDYEGIMQETCVTVTWMKLCNQLLMLTGNAKYADYVEKSLYNALYGAINNNKNTSNGGFMFDSYSPLTLGTRGRLVGGNKYISEDKNYGCCVAIGAAGTALPLLTALMLTKSGVAVNYYESGKTEIGDYILSVKTEYPAKNRVEITVESAKKGESEISLRIPEFSAERTKVFINRNEFKGEIENAPCYAKICREWKAGDIIEIIFDMNPHVIRPQGVEGKPKTKDFFAVIYGPLVLARDKQITSVGDTVALGELEVVPTENSIATFAAKVKVGNTDMTMIDYASAGKTWNEDSLMEAWIKCE